MNQGIQYLLGMMMVFLFLPSCHFIEKKEVSGKQELSSVGRGLASVSPQDLFANVPFVRVPSSRGVFKIRRVEIKHGQRSYYEKESEFEITRSFELMKTEVTQKQWYMVMKYHPNKSLRNPSYFKREGDCNNHEYRNGVGICPDHPVEQVSYNEVQEFIKKLNAMSGCSREVVRDNRRGKWVIDIKGCYRLPTDVEWEWAVRARTKGVYFFSHNADLLGKYAWYNNNSQGRTHQVMTRHCNPWKLCDMYGNVSEWVQDDNKLLAMGIHFIRGGSWRSFKLLIGSDVRRDSWAIKDDFIGFRLVRTL